MLQRGLAGLALLGLVLFGCMSNGATRFYTWPWVFYGQLLLLTPVALLGLDLQREPRPLLARRVVWALLAVAAAIVLSTSLSLRPRFSFETALFLCSGLALAALSARRVAAADLATTARPPRLIGILLALPLLSSAVLWSAQLAQDAPPGNWAEFVLRLTSLRNLHPAGHWNYTAGLALLALPWLLTLVWNERGGWRALWLLLSAIASAVLLSAASRGASLGIVAALVVAILAWALRRGFRRRTLVLLAAAALAAGALLAIANPRLRSSLIPGSGHFVPTEGDVQRLGMLQGGTYLFLARPIVGHGAGMTPFVYPSVRARLVGGVETSFQLHSSPLQWAVDHGIVGLAAAVFLGLTLLAATRRWWRRPDSDPFLPYALASACTLVGYAALALTDYQLNVIAIAAAVAFHLGVVLAGCNADSVASRSGLSKTRLPSLPLLGGAIGAAVLLIPSWQARQLFWSAWWECEATDRSAIAGRLRAAAEKAPWMPYYRSHYALFLAAQAHDRPARAAARRELEISLALDPLQEPCEASLGWLWLTDDASQAERHFRAALALVPDRDTLHLGLAYARLAQRNTVGATAALATECIVNPEFVASPLWDYPPLKELRSAVASETDRQFAAILSHPALPAWRRPALRYTSAFIRWWREGAIPTTEELAGAGEIQRRAFLALASGTTVPGRLPPAWSNLAAARNHPADATTLLQQVPGIPAPAVDGALARLAESASVSLADLLRSPAPSGRGLVSTSIEHGHFAIMHCNLDGPGYPDLHPRLRDSFTDSFVGLLYPPRWLVPGPVLGTLAGEGDTQPHHPPSVTDHR